MIDVELEPEFDERPRLLAVLRQVVTHLLERRDLTVDDVLDAYEAEKERGGENFDPARLLVRIVNLARADGTGSVTTGEVLRKITEAVRFRPATSTPDRDDR